MPTQLTFTSDTFTTSSGQVGTYSGTLSVAYTTHTFTGTMVFNIPGAGGTNTVNITTQGIQTLQSLNGQTVYTLSANVQAGGVTTQFDIRYPFNGGAGQTPSQTTSVTVTQTNNAGTGTPGTFTASTDNNGLSGNPTTQPVTADCFVTGTLIRTARGEVPVEELRVGELAVTASGEARPIRWIGQRTLTAEAGGLLPFAQWPVRVRAGAFGASLPERDLLLSAGHPVLVGKGEDEVLVPIMCLINGTTIERRPVSTITYWHVELDGHDILLAEGLPAESYMDLGSRGWFERQEDGPLVDPELVPAGRHGRCRPVAFDGALVEAERRRLDAVFGAELAGACAWPGQDVPLWA